MKKSLKIILLFILLLLLQFYVYINSEYTTINALIYGFCDIVLYSILLMTVPILMRLHNGKKFENEKGKKICTINSIVAWLILIFLSSLFKSYNIPISLNIGWLGAIIYYFINYYITTETDK